MKQKLPGKFSNCCLVCTISVIMLFTCVFDGFGSAGAFSSPSVSFPFQVDQIKKDSAQKTDLQNTPGEKSYRVQVCALRKMLKDIGILEKACGQKILIEELVDGYYKYVTTSFRGYGEALKKLSEVRSMPGFEGAFLVLYLDGKRIKPLYAAKRMQDSGQASNQINSNASDKKRDTQFIKSTPEPGKKLLAKSVQQPKPVLAEVKGREAIHTEPIVVNNEEQRSRSREVKIYRPVQIVAGITPHFVPSNLMLTVLIFLATCFLLLVLYLVVVHLLKIKRQRDILALRELYAEELASYWSGPSGADRVPELFENTDDDFRKDLLISEMMAILNTLPETAGDRVRELYFKLHFDLYSFKKLHSKKWTEQAMGVHELAAFLAFSEADSVEELISNPHPALRHEVISAIVRLRPDDPFGFLDRLRVPFTKRDQLSAIAVLEKYHLEDPAFSRWFDAYDPNLVVFAVEMSCRYRQTEAGEHFDKLLRHSYEEVRISVIKAIGEMRLKEFSTRLIPLFNEVSYEPVQLLILQTMAMLEDPSLLNFLSDLVLLDSSMKIRMEAAKALINIGPQGLTRMQTLLLKQDSDIRYIYHQIIG